MTLGYYGVSKTAQIFQILLMMEFLPPGDLYKMMNIKYVFKTMEQLLLFISMRDMTLRALLMIKAHLIV